MMKGECLFSDFEYFLTHSAEGANPIFGEVFKTCAGGDASFGVTNFGVVNVVTNGAKILFHSSNILVVSNSERVPTLSVLGLQCKSTMRFLNKQTDGINEHIDNVDTDCLSIKTGILSSAMIYCCNSLLLLWRKTLPLQLLKSLIYLYNNLTIAL